MEIGRYYKVGDVPDDVDSFHVGYPWAPLGLFHGGSTHGDTLRWPDIYMHECDPDDPDGILFELGTVVQWARSRGGVLPNPHRADIGTDWMSQPSHVPERWYANCVPCGWEGPRRTDHDDAWADAMRHRSDPRLFGGDRVVLPGLYREDGSGTERRYGGGVFDGDSTTWKFVGH